MARHTTTHLFFRLNDSRATSRANKEFGSSSGNAPRKPQKKPITTTLNHELSSSSFDYYDYFSHYNRMTTPPHSPAPLLGSRERYDEPRRAYSYDREHDRRLWRRSSPSSSKYEMMRGASSPERILYRQSHHVSGHPNMLSPEGDDIDTQSPLHDEDVIQIMSSPRETDQLLVLTPDNCLHRITFIETHIYQAQDLLSPIHQPKYHRQPPQPAQQHYDWMIFNAKQLRSHFNHPSHQILMNVERKSKFPFVVYSSGNADLSTCDLSPELRYTDGMYSLVSAITRPGSGYENVESTRPSGFIICAFATFPGEDSEKLESNWISWTGARIIYKCIPMCIGLRRMMFLKRTLTDLNEEILMMGPFGFTYVLLCECFNLDQSHLASACTTIDQLRARCCGYSALYINYQL